MISGIDRDNSHTFVQLTQLLKGRNVYIQTHNFPDPDAIGSAFGLQRLLKHYGIDSKICYNGKIDRLNTKKMIDLLGIEICSKEELEGQMGEDDPIICVDSQKNGGNILDLIGDEVACIDHHPTAEEVDYYYKDVRRVGACSSIIADYFADNDIPILKSVFVGTSKRLIPPFILIRIPSERTNGDIISTNNPDSFLGILVAIERESRC